MSKLPDPGCVVKVGDGRGFVFEQRISTTGFAKRKPIKGLQLRRFIERRLIFTAAHCLPKLPPAHAAAFNSERTYKLLGSLDGTKENVCAECLFVDPVADIAVLGCPDNQELYEEAEGYEDLTDDAPVVPIGKPRSGKGWILALDGKNWIQTELDLFTGLYGTSLSIGPTEPGMSGSPILNGRGRAVGVVVIGSETINSSGERRVNEKAGPQPILTLNLPGWLL